MARIHAYTPIGDYVRVTYAIVQGLLLRLSQIDVDAESAVRVIAYFDALVEHGATLSELVRASAVLAGCPAGLEREGLGRLRVAADGSRVPDDAPLSPSSTAAVTDDTRVWLENTPEDGPFDDLILERFAMCVRMLGRPLRSATPHPADPALIELLLAEGVTDEERTRVLHLLGMGIEIPVVVIAVATDKPRGVGLEATALVTRSRPVRTVRVAVIGNVAAVVMQPTQRSDEVVGDLRSALAGRARERGSAQNAIRVGVGGAVSALKARHSWQEARTAVRFATAQANTPVEYASLGSLALLAELPTSVLMSNPDVASLESLATTSRGIRDIAVLEMFCRTNSMRTAGRALHCHHSAVAASLKRSGSALGCDLSEQRGRMRAELALLARHLVATAPET